MQQVAIKFTQAGLNLKMIKNMAKEQSKAKVSQNNKKEKVQQL